MWIIGPGTCSNKEMYCKMSLNFNHTMMMLWNKLLFISFPHVSGHVFGIGKVNVLTATPYATDNESKPLYGVSPVSSSHNNTP